MVDLSSGQTISLVASLQELANLSIELQHIASSHEAQVKSLTNGLQCISSVEVPKRSTITSEGSESGTKSSEIALEGVTHFLSPYRRSSLMENMDSIKSSGFSPRLGKIASGDVEDAPGRFEERALSNMSSTWVAEQHSIDHLEKVSWVRQQSGSDRRVAKSNSALEALAYSESADRKSEVHFNLRIDDRQQDSHGVGSARFSTQSDFMVEHRSTLLSRASTQPLVKILPIWEGEDQLPSTPSLIRGQSWKVDGKVAAIRFTDDHSNEPPGFLDCVVVLPGSIRRLIWEVMGMLLIFYDLIVIPLQVFETKDNDVMDWVTILYWTFDIPLSFLVGFHSKGVVIARVPAIANRYLKSWFLFDVTVIAFDWVISFAGGGDSQFKEMLRFLRVVRLLRLFKMAGIMRALMKRIKSESVIILLGILKLIVFIMCVNHVIACIWYWVGFESAKFSSRSWIEHNHMTDASMGYKYTTSLHWSLTQFTPASMEVVPKNAMERTYTVITLIFAMVTFSSFVSSITNAMTRLRNLNSEKMEQHSVLRQYLVENKISTPLTTAVCGFVERGLRHDGQRTHCQDVKILRDLPKILQDELQDEVYTPILTVHPFFQGFYCTYPKGMARLYRFAMQEVPLSCGAELFNIGDSATHMFFMITGTLMYSLAATGWGSLRGDTLKPPTWLAEQALWIEWRHCGQAVATSHTEVLAVKADRFQSIVCMELVGVFEPKSYARQFTEFADTLAQNLKLNDMCSWRESRKIEELADDVWGTERASRRSDTSTDEKSKGFFKLLRERTFSSSYVTATKSRSRTMSSSADVSATLRGTKATVDRK